MKKVLLLVIGLAFISCSKNVSYDKEQAKVDSTKAVISVALERIESFDQDSLFLYKKELEWYYNNIMPQHVEGDTRSFWTEEVTDLNFCRKNMNSYFEQKNAVIQKLELSKMQLNNLSHDLEHNVVVDSLVEVFVMQELRTAKSTYVLYGKRIGRGLDCFNDKSAVLQKAEHVLQTLNSEK